MNPRPRLSPEGEIRRDAHEFLINEFIAERETKITGEITDRGDERILHEVVVSRPNVRVTDHASIELPPGSQRVGGMFRHFVLRGTGLLRIRSLAIQPFSGHSPMHRSQETDEFFRVQMAIFPLPAKDLPKVSLEVHCEGSGQTVINAIEFHSQGRLGMRFDDLSYRNLGFERPPIELVVSIDPTTERSIAGTADLQRERWFRYYAALGTVPKELERWAANAIFVRDGRSSNCNRPS